VSVRRTILNNLLVELPATDAIFMSRSTWPALLLNGATAPSVPLNLTNQEYCRHVE
jgi:hypothetical protein